ncbi:MAG: hypothetical protein EU532_05390 [Promethearchaeota archaeon]|nr:MAG: hypothetical protein EU532_05390 [Candidatus Lokiarchaeota archaeon]
MLRIIICSIQIAVELAFSILKNKNENINSNKNKKIVSSDEISKKEIIEDLADLLNLSLLKKA